MSRTPPKPQELSSQALKKISPRNLLDYIIVNFAPYHAHDINKTKGVVNLEGNLKDRFTTLITEICEIRNPNSKSYRADHQDFLERFCQELDLSTALFYANETADKALKAAVDKIIKSAPVINENIHISEPPRDNTATSAANHPKPNAANDGDKRTTISPALLAENKITKSTQAHQNIVAPIARKPLVQNSSAASAANPPTNQQRYRRNNSKQHSKNLSSNLSQ